MAKDKIQLKGMVFYGYHGARPAEKESGQRFIIDIEAEKDLRIAGQSDDPKDTVSYSDMFRIVKAIVEGPGHNLLESLANDIAAEILWKVDVDAVTVKVKKPGVPIKGSILDYAAVEIYREKKGD